MLAIKFRAWDNEGQQYIYSDDRDFCCVVMKSGEVVFYYIDGKEMHEMNHEKAEQNIGLKDKNGVEIYEGDIFSDGEDGYLVVEYSRTEAAFILAQYNYSMWFNECGGEEYGNELERIDFHFMQEFHIDELEIIGNRFDNPELLEVKT